MESKEETTSDVIRVCIIGAGLSGLATAASLLEEAKRHPEKKFKIEIVEKRDLDFKRRQKIVITPYRNINVHHPKAMRESLRWDDFCQPLFDPGKQLQVDGSGILLQDDKEIKEDLNEQQKFLRKLMRQREFWTPFFKSPKNFSIKSLQKAIKDYLDKSKVGNIEIVWHEKTIAEKVNLSEGSLDAVDIATNCKQHIHFDYLMVCEGEYREEKEHQGVVKQMNEEMTEEKKFKYQAIGKKSHHMAVRLTVKEPPDGDYRKFLEEQRKLYDEGPSISEAVENLGWPSSRDNPQYILDTNLYKESMNDDQNWRPRLFVAGEIPDALFEIQDKEEKRQAILKWGRIFASRLMSIPENCFEIDTKGEDAHNRLNAVTFTSDIKSVDNPMRQLSNGSYVVLIGDSAMSAYYPLGFSSTMAMNEAIQAAKCIASDESHIENRFQPLITKFNEYAEMLQDILGLRQNSSEHTQSP